MALQSIEFDIKPGTGNAGLNVPAHFGVVGSGDLEVLMTPKDLQGAVSVRIVTPVTGFDDLWRRVLENFASEVGLANVRIEINDNNATPAVVLLRLRQAFSNGAAS